MIRWNNYRNNKKQDLRKQGCSKKKYSISLIISTYNSDKMLRLCLHSVARQTILPNEVIVADDGSTEETKRCVDLMRTIIKCPVKHVWQRDDGFQLSKIRNKAIAIAECDYIIQIDGDLILDKHFVEDHLNHAKKRFLSAGSRCLLTKGKTNEVMGKEHYSPHWFSLGIKSRENGVRIPFLTHFLKRGKRVLGCNMAFFRSDIVAINGYNENLTGWGHEDLELKQRMINSGMRVQRIKFCAVTFHLWHSERSRNNEQSHFQLVEEEKKKKVTRIDNGIDKYINSKETITILE